jgi:hypothetical protein
MKTEETIQVRITKKTHIKLTDALSDIYRKTKKKITVKDFIDQAVKEKIQNNSVLNN